MELSYKQTEEGLEEIIVHIYDGKDELANSKTLLYTNTDGDDMIDTILWESQSGYIASHPQKLTRTNMNRTNELYFSEADRKLKEVRIYFKQQK